MPLLVLSLILLLGSAPASNAHNITRILAQHPEFSTFNHYLTATHLAGEINRRETITVLVVDNSAMSALLHKHHSFKTIKNLLSLHILIDYFGAKKLHELTRGTALSSTMFQAPGTAGFVNITDHRAGHVTFSAQDSGAAPPASVVKSIKEIPHNISVIQISTPLASPASEVPTAAPVQVNLTTLMSVSGCKLFADLLTATAGVERMFDENVESGLTVFCPIDGAMKAFMPKFKKLTNHGKGSLLLYHGIPVYSSIQMLRSNNGLYTTLATDGTSKNYHLTIENEREVVTLRSRRSKATITLTLFDVIPLAVYTIDEVLMPMELFKGAAVAEAAAAEKGAKAADQKVVDDSGPSDPTGF